MPLFEALEREEHLIGGWPKILNEQIQGKAMSCYLDYVYDVLLLLFLLTENIVMLL